MGLYPQPNDWTCGPFALKHGLISLGRLVSGDKLTRLAGSRWWSGTDEIGLAAAARANECDLGMVRKRSPEKARKELISLLREGVPVVLCVDDWAHWITVVGVERSNFVVVDSNMEPVLNVLTWAQLRKRWQYLDRDYDAEEPPAIYDMCPVVPRFRVTIKANFSVERVRYLRRFENRHLAHSWDVYLEDLLAICRPPSHRLTQPLSMAEFLRRNQAMIVSHVVYWHGDVERKDIMRLLGNFRFVAETYGLVIPESNSRRATVDIAILATMWAVAWRGIGDMYGSAGEGRG